MLLVGSEIFRGKNDGLAGEAVAKGVERYPALTFGADWSAGMGGVLAIDFGAINGRWFVHDKNFGCSCAGRERDSGIKPDLIEDPEDIDPTARCPRALGQGCDFCFQPVERAGEKMVRGFDGDQALGLWEGRDQR